MLSSLAQFHLSIMHIIQLAIAGHAIRFMSINDDARSFDSVELHKMPRGSALFAAWTDRYSFGSANFATALIPRTTYINVTYN